MPIKKIEIHGLNPEHPLAKVVDEINSNLDNILEHVNGIDAETGVVGATGAKGDKGDPGQQGIEGPAGKDGQNGKDGVDGKDGKDGQDGAVGPQGQQGLQGEPGPPGKDGRNGVDGKNGADGLPGAMGPQGPAGVQGLPGKDGKDGVSITSAVVNSTGNLIITKSDGTTVDAGKVSATSTTTTTAPVVGGPPVVGGAVNPFAPSTPVATSTKGYAAAYVDAGTFVTLDNLKFTVTTGGQRGLSCATVSGTTILAISAHYAMIGGVAGSATNWSTMPTYTTTPSGSWFGWSFPNAGDASTYNIQEVNTKNFYRVTLMIGPAYNKNFISIERLY